MKLDRNLNAQGNGKYAVVNLRRMRELEGTDAHREACIALEALELAGVLERGNVGAPDEFFLIKLKDKHAQSALAGYAASAEIDDPEWAREVDELGRRSGPAHPLCKAPD